MTVLFHNCNVTDKKNVQISVSDADREITSLVSALSVYPRDWISASASETDDRFYFFYTF